MQRLSIIPLEEALVFQVAANMRASDVVEVGAMSPAGVVRPADLAREACDRSRFGAVAVLDGEPAAAWGAMETWPGTWSVWLIATDAWPRVWRAVVRWVRSHMAAQMQAARAQCLFVFALHGREDAARLLKALGFKARGVVPKFGAGGEPFILWSRTGGAR